MDVKACVWRILESHLVKQSSMQAREMEVSRLFMLYPLVAPDIFTRNCFEYRGKANMLAALE